MKKRARDEENREQEEVAAATIRRKKFHVLPRLVKQKERKRERERERQRERNLRNCVSASHHRWKLFSVVKNRFPPLSRSSALAISAQECS